MGPLPTRASLPPLRAFAAPRHFACFPRVSACGRKSSRHPPPPNRTSTGMCQGRERRFPAEAENRVPSVPVGFFQGPSDRCRRYFTLLPRRHARSSALLRPYCMRLVPPVDPTSVSVSSHRYRPSLRPAALSRRRACHRSRARCVALTRPHCTFRIPLLFAYPFRKGSFLPRPSCRCSLLRCPPQPPVLPFRPEEHPLDPLGPLGRTHPSGCRVRSLGLVLLRSP